MISVKLKGIGILQIALFFAIALTSIGCNRSVNMNERTAMICDPDSGICESPETEKTVQQPMKAMNQKTKLVYFTDPICSACWAIEPQLKQLKLTYGDDIEIEYHMGGLLSNWESMQGASINSPAVVAHHWDQMSSHYKMPIDGDVWLEDPLASSYPPSIAFKAAQVQSEDKALAYLRRMREMVFVEKKNITRWEHISLAAIESGLDTTRLKEDINGIGMKLFEQDLMLSRQMGVRGFPTVFVMKEEQDPVLVYGARSFDIYAQAIRAVDPTLNSELTLSQDEVFQKFSSFTLREMAELANITLKEAEDYLEAQVAASKCKKTQTKNGSLYSKLP